jgi:alginate O-acetyltransferase complex protein AlgI
MLFNSFGFLFIFLPVTAIGFFVIARSSHQWAAGWLALASLFFYGWWDVRYVPLLLGSVVFNYWSGKRIGQTAAPYSRRWLTFAVAANLLLLGYFKYADFTIASVNVIAHAQHPLRNVVLPIGISFFTFTQIAFLVDTYRREVREYRFVHYLLFVTYFPHLIAGPVLHHKEMMPQFGDEKTYSSSARNWAVGLSIFFIGLAKKVLIADNLADYATFFFDKTDAPSLFIAWGGVLAYAFQLYFDFSGYSDMAIGLSRLFGIRLPLNFASPYKAANIIDFWRHWHMTLSRFLRDYLYFPLGGGRHGSFRRYINLMLTMVLGGLWHGAGWNYVAWGALHGLYLMINHAWIGLTGPKRASAWPRLWSAASVALTFAAVCFAWVFFRAADMSRATDIVLAMTGLSGVGLPESIGNHLGALRPLLEQWGISFYSGGGARFVQTYTWVALAAAICFLLPNTQQIMSGYAPALDYAAAGDPLAQSRIARRLRWSPNLRWALWIGLMATMSLLSLNRPAAFLYFQF